MNGVAVSPDGQYIISASSDKTLKIWELETGKERCTFAEHSSWVNGVAVSPDGQYIISALSDNTVKMWELKTGKEVQILAGHSDLVNGVAVSPNGQFIVSVSEDQKLKLWEVLTGREVMNFTGEGAFYCCTIVQSQSRNNSPNIHTVIAGDSGGQLYALRLEGPEFSNN